MNLYVTLTGIITQVNGMLINLSYQTNKVLTTDYKFLYFRYLLHYLWDADNSLCDSSPTKRGTGATARDSGSGNRGDRHSAPARRVIHSVRTDTLYHMSY